jgi:hypothetical protein
MTIMLWRLFVKLSEESVSNDGRRRETEAMARALPLLTAYDYIQRFDPERLKSLSPSYPDAPLDYYEGVRRAYSESVDLRNYLDCSVEAIDKDLKTLFPLTYRLIHELQIGRAHSKGILQILDVDLSGNPKSDDLMLRWVIGASTPLELIEQERQQ